MNNKILTKEYQTTPHSLPFTALPLPPNSRLLQRWRLVRRLPEHQSRKWEKPVITDQLPATMYGDICCQAVKMRRSLTMYINPVN
jgi:hypothetical protein